MSEEQQKWPLKSSDSQTLMCILKSGKQTPKQLFMLTFLSQSRPSFGLEHESEQFEAFDSTQEILTHVVDRRFAALWYSLTGCQLLN